jgi:hypothetical protein
VHLSPPHQSSLDRRLVRSVSPFDVRPAPTSPADPFIDQGHTRHGSRHHTTLPEHTRRNSTTPRPKSCQGLNTHTLSRLTYPPPPPAGPAGCSTLRPPARPPERRHGMASSISAAAKASAAFAHKVRPLPPTPSRAPLLTNPLPFPVAEGAGRAGAAPRGLEPPDQAVPRARRRVAGAHPPRPVVHRLGTPPPPESHPAAAAVLRFAFDLHTYEYARSPLSR